MNMIEYDQWARDPTADNMGRVVRALTPVINSEIQRYNGPKPLLKAKAKSLAAQAVKSYDPTKGAHLRSWLVTQMQPLARYSQQLKPVQIPEVANRQAAEVNRVRQQLSDELGREPTHIELADVTGLNPKRIQKLREMAQPVIMESAFDVAEDSERSLPGVTSTDTISVAEDMVYDSLDERDKMIFDLKTGKHGRVSLANQEIARRLGVTPALVSQRSSQIAGQISDLATRKRV